MTKKAPSFVGSSVRMQKIYNHCNINYPRRGKCALHTLCVIIHCKLEETERDRLAYWRVQTERLGDTDHGTMEDKANHSASPPAA